MFSALWLLGSMVIDYLTPKGIDGLHDRAGRYRHSTFLLFALPHDRFRIDIGYAFAGRGVDKCLDFAGAATGLFDRRCSGTCTYSRSNLDLAPLPLERPTRC